MGVEGASVPAGRDGMRTGWKVHGVVTRESQEAGEYRGGWNQKGRNRMLDRKEQ